MIYEQDQGGNENYHSYRVDPSKPDEVAKDLTPQEGVRAGIIDLPRGQADDALISLNARDKKYFDVYFSPANLVGRDEARGEKSRRRGLMVC